MERDAVLRRFGRVHRAVLGDGADVLERMLITCEQMLRDRGCRHVRRAADPLGAICSGEATPTVRGALPADDEAGGGDEEGEGEETVVYVHGEDKVGVKFARGLLEAHPDARIVVVSPEGPTPFTRRECEGQVQFLTARFVSVNVTRHALVPAHRRVEGPPPGTTLAQLPKILENDPVVQYYAWPLGTVVRVERRFGGHETAPYFRVVSPASS